MRETENFVFFWDGIYSQWYPSIMIIDGERFNCCEQYMMYQKALVFKDHDTAEKIMDTESPAEQKSLGRLVKNFDRDKWDQYCMGIVTTGNFHKFIQNPSLGKQLLETGDKIIVEASPLDKIWGIGKKETDPLIENPENWRGLNLLGTAIMNARSMLRHKLYIVD